jgi:hypothetical protein
LNIWRTLSSGYNKFLHELRSAYIDVLNQRKHLDDKAASMLTVSSTVTSLLFGFGIFILTRIDPIYPLSQHASILLVAAIVLNIVSVSVSIRAFKTENYRYASTSARYFEKGEYTEEDANEARNYNEVEIEYIKDMNPTEFENMLIHDYLSCNHLNSKYNARKAGKITLSQRLLLIGIGIVPIIVIILYHAASENEPLLIL